MTPTLSPQPEAAPSGMVEAVARALSDGLGNKPWADVRTRDKEAFRDQARLALAALREPTDAMLRATGMLGPNRSRTYWQAMIDAALEEGA